MKRSITTEFEESEYGCSHKKDHGHCNPEMLHTRTPDEYTIEKEYVMSAWIGQLQTKQIPTSTTSQPFIATGFYIFQNPHNPSLQIIFWWLLSVTRSESWITSITKMHPWAHQLLKHILWNIVIRPSHTSNVTQLVTKIWLYDNKCHRKPNKPVAAHWKNLCQQMPSF